MDRFTVEETNLMCIYDSSTRKSLIADIEHIQSYIEETELAELAQQLLEKLKRMSDDEYMRIKPEPAEDFKEPVF